MQALIDEIVEITTNLSEQKEEYKKMETKIQETFATKLLFDILSFAGTAFSLATGGIGIIGAIIAGTSQIGKTLIPEDDPDSIKKVVLPPGAETEFTEVRLGIEYLAKNKSSKLILKIDNVIKVLESKQNMKNSVEKLKNLKDQIVGSENSLEKLLEFEEQIELEMKTALVVCNEKRRQKIEKEKPDDNKIWGEFVEGTFEAINAGITDYISKNDKLAQIGAFIQKVDSQINQMVEYKRNVEKSLTPMMTNMVGHLNSAIKGVEGQSQVILDVTKWKVQDYLKEIKLEIMKFTEGFKVESDMVQLIDKLTNAMTTIIFIYDRIQSYQELQNQVNYMADLASAQFTDFKPSSDFAAISRELEIKIQWNLILQKHKNTMKA
jgi:hypothetical protein